MQKFEFSHQNNLKTFLKEKKILVLIIHLSLDFIFFMNEWCLATKSTFARIKERTKNINSSQSQRN